MKEDAMDHLRTSIEPKKRTLGIYSIGSFSIEFFSTLFNLEKEII